MIQYLSLYMSWEISYKGFIVLTWPSLDSISGADIIKYERHYTCITFFNIVGMKSQLTILKTIIISIP